MSAAALVALAIADHVPAGAGVALGALGFGFGLGVQHGDAQLGGHAAFDDLGEAFLQGLDFVVRDADQRGGPLGHQYSLARICPRYPKESSREVASSLSWLRKLRSPG
jgi:hypothetical protein